MTRWLTGVAGLGLMACSNLPNGENGVVALELRLPSPAAVEQHDTLRLVARALNADGDSVDAPIFWRSLDDSVLTMVDSTGLVTTDTTGGTARVQARVGSLRSDLVTLTLRRRSDTLILAAPDTITVPAADSVSGALVGRVESFNPAGGVAGTSILFEVVDSLAAQGTLQFSNGRLAFRATTGSDGGPAATVTLRKVGAGSPPPVVEVHLTALRPSRTQVPGSGQVVTLLFQ